MARVLCALVLLLIPLCVVAALVRVHVSYDARRHSACFLASGSGGLVTGLVPAGELCDIGLIPVDLPADFKRAALALAVAARPGVGKRVDVPLVKAGRTVPTEAMLRLLPASRGLFEGLARTVSDAVGEAVVPGPLDTPLALSMLVYDRAGDHVRWHYDSNYFVGRFFTLLVPLTAQDNGCTEFQFLDARQRVTPVRLPVGQGLLFEGERIWHRATRMCEGDAPRVVLSMQFTTDPRVRRSKWAVKAVKEFVHGGGGS
jgi:hypothetical protein